MTIDESDALHPIGFAGGGYYESAALLAASLFKAPCVVIRVDADVPETLSHASPSAAPPVAAGWHYSTPGYAMDAAGQLVRGFMPFALAGVEPADDEPPLVEFMRCSLADKEGRPLGMLMLFDCAGRPPLTPKGRRLLERLAAHVVDRMQTLRDFHYRDHLTGLGNRGQFVRDARMALDRPRAQDADLWAAMIDVIPLDNITRLVVAMGLTQVERAIERMAARVMASLPGGCRTYRLGLARFGFMCSGKQDDVRRLAAGCVARFENPITVDDDLPLNLTAYAGVLPVRRSQLPQLISALFAVSESARERGVPVGVFDLQLVQRQRRHVLIINSIRQAVQAPDQLRLVFQPRERLSDGIWTSVEALVRWRHPLLGEISPTEFIPLLEGTTLMPLLTDWVLARAMSQLAEWRKTMPKLKMSINVAASDLKRPDFSAVLRGAMAANGIGSGCIELELTEGSLVRVDPATMEMLEGLERCGIEIAVDDFGAGYSNLSQLAKLPYDVLKLDNALVRSVSSNARAALIVQAIVGLAKQLGHRVVAEGVETLQLRDFSQQWGCDEVQGFFIARPMEPDALYPLLAQRVERRGAPRSQDAV
ncbi:signalling protein [Bordetella ansorpii]|uniref:Signalling protein n=1 Tax=Bordetella ansorpii TaxID=288768 RepID=A0A157SG92_9BORD|nr:bifunctional diguanylate cyclase/phosphodiesterase [Bordetella ansorpii]SAI69419.1 signalling protein [Bordetella ansorpii]